MYHYSLICFKKSTFLEHRKLKQVYTTVKQNIVNSLGLQVSFLCYVKVRTMLLFCAFSPKNPLGENATVPLTHIRLQADYFIASLVGNLIPPISTLNHKMFNLTSVLLYFVHFLLFFLLTLLITQLFCWVFSNEKCICRPIVKRLNGQSVTLHSTVTVAPQSVNVTFTVISIVVKIKTRKFFINFIE